MQRTSTRRCRGRSRFALAMAGSVAPVPLAQPVPRELRVPLAQPVPRVRRVRLAQPVPGALRVRAEQPARMAAMASTALRAIRVASGLLALTARIAPTVSTASLALTD